MPHAVFPRSLSDVTIGEAAVVSGLAGDERLCARLAEMGLTAGTSVRLVRIAPLGDPLEFELRGYRLSLRRAEAAAVLVSRANPLHPAAGSNGRAGANAARP